MGSCNGYGRREEDPRLHRLRLKCCGGCEVLQLQTLTLAKFLVFFSLYHLLLCFKCFYIWSIVFFLIHATNPKVLTLKKDMERGGFHGYRKFSLNTTNPSEPGSAIFICIENILCTSLHCHVSSVLMAHADVIEAQTFCN